MLKKERHRYILHQIDLYNKVLSSELCISMQVSEDTVRRDLQELADERKLIKVHGGALSLNYKETPYDSDKVYARSAKSVIAQKAIKLLNNNMFVLTGGGTTILEFARNIPLNLQATFISGSIPVLNYYSNYSNINTISIGGRIDTDSKISKGADAVGKIKEIHADICFMGISGISTERGITDIDWEIVELKKAMFASSDNKVIMTISEKLNTSRPLRVCEITDIDYLITELDPEDARLRPYKDLGISIL